MSLVGILKLLSIIVISLFVLGCVALYLLCRFSDWTGHTTEVTRYPEILAKNSPHAQHFPHKIPTEATDIHLDYQPRVLQGGMHFQLRLRLPSDYIDTLYAQFSIRATHTFKGGDSNIHTNLSDCVPTTNFYTSDTETHSFPPTYELFVLDAQPTGRPEFVWNHGYSYGVALDRQTSYIVYWSECW